MTRPPPGPGACEDLGVPGARIGLIADDLTGACDSAVAFLGGGSVQVGIWPWVPEGELICAAVTTESRAETPSVARARVAEAQARLAARLVYRKLDSMLRGNPVADLEPVLDERPAVVAPALPSEGRLTVNGIQRWRGGESDLHSVFAPLGARVELADAASDGDLDAIAARVLRRGDRVLAGSAGLAAALARTLGLSPPAPGPRPGCARPVAVVGTPAAAEQARVASRRGVVVTAAPGQVPDLGDADGLVVTGGETAARLLCAYGARGLELVGEPLPRIPMGRVMGGRLEGLPVILKAGSFGPPDAILRALEYLSG